MMILNRMKSSMVMAAMAVVMFATTACNDEPDRTPAEELFDAVRDGNQTLDDLVTHDAVITTQVVLEIMEPIGAASEKFNEQVLAWETKEPSVEYRSRELTTYGKANSGLTYLLSNLDKQGFAATSEGSACDVIEEPIDDGSGNGSGYARTKSPDSTTELGAVFSEEYWSRIFCKAACAAAGTLCVTACGPTAAGGPVVIACVAACFLATAACDEGCSGFCNR